MTNDRKIFRFHELSMSNHTYSEFHQFMTIMSCQYNAMKTQCANSSYAQASEFCLNVPKAFKVTHSISTHYLAAVYSGFGVARLKELSAWLLYN